MTLVIAMGLAFALAGALMLAAYCVHVLREARRSRLLLQANFERLFIRANAAALADRDRARRVADGADTVQDRLVSALREALTSAPGRS